jgi:RNA polymerase sigma-70 factor (ECF subfamily)
LLRTWNEPQVTGQEHANGPRPPIQPAVAEEAAGGAVESWLTSMRPRLVRLAQQFLNHAGDAEEVAQEALTLVWQRLETLKDVGKRNAWVYRTTINLSLNRRRRRRPETRLEENTCSDRPDGSPAEHGELAQRIRAVMSELSENQSAALVLREIEGLDYDTVAAILEMRPGAVRVLVHRARETLRRTLLQRWPDTFG